MTNTQTRRILAVHWDGAGNLPPQRALARGLIRRRHEVHVLSHNSTVEQMRSDGAVFHALASARQLSAADQMPSDPNEETMFVVNNVVASRAFANDFLDVVDHVRPDICLIDAALASVLVASEKITVPCVALYHTIFSPAMFDPLLPLLLAQMPDMDPMWTYQGALKRLPLILAFSYPEFGALTNFSSHVHHVGPIREPVEHSVWPRRYADRPLLLVSLSTSFQWQHAMLQRICDALSSLPVEALVTTGPNIAPESLTAGDGVVLRSFVPHDQVLPLVDLVITHAGLGTAMAAVGAGVPILCMPVGRDQPLNAERVEALGLGRTLSPQAPADEIGRAVTAILGDRVLRARSRSFAEGVARFGDLNAAVHLVESLP